MLRYSQTPKSKAALKDEDVKSEEELKEREEPKTND